MGGWRSLMRRRLVSVSSRKAVSRPHAPGDHIAPLLQTLGLVGAAIVLVAFIRSTYGSLSQTSLAYGLMNCVGTLLLAISVIEPFSAGAFVVETVWCVASAGLVIRAIKARQP